MQTHFLDYGSFCGYKSSWRFLPKYPSHNNNSPSTRPFRFAQSSLSFSIQSPPFIAATTTHRRCISAHVPAILEHHGGSNEAQHMKQSDASGAAVNSAPGGRRRRVATGKSTRAIRTWEAPWSTGDARFSKAEDTHAWLDCASQLPSK